MSEATRKVLHLTRTLHIYLTMFSSIVLFFFALSGFMMNHKSWFGLGGESGGERRPPSAQGGAEQPSPERSGMRPDKSQDGAARSADGPQQERGLLAKLTSLHKGKPSRLSVVLLIDISAVLLMLGSITGIVLLLSLPQRRRLGLIAVGVGTVAGLIIFLLASP